MTQRYFSKAYNLVGANITLDPLIHQSGAVFTNTGAGGVYTVGLPTLSSPAYDGYTVSVIQTSNAHITGFASADSLINWYDGNNSASGTESSVIGTGAVGTVMQATWFDGAWLVEVLTGTTD